MPAKRKLDKCGVQGTAVPLSVSGRALRGSRSSSPQYGAVELGTAGRNGMVMDSSSSVGAGSVQRTRTSALDEGPRRNGRQNPLNVVGAVHPRVALGPADLWRPNRDRRVLRG